MNAVERINAMRKAEAEKKAAEKAARYAEVKGYLIEHTPEILKDLTECIIGRFVGGAKSSTLKVSSLVITYDDTICVQMKVIAKTFRQLISEDFMEELLYSFMIDEIVPHLEKEGFSVTKSSVGWIWDVTIPEDESEEESKQSPYELTNRQAALLEQLQNIVCQCKAENLDFVYDVEEGKVRTFNAEHNYIEWTEYDGTMSDKFLEMMPKVISNVTHYFSDCPEQYKWVEI